MTHIDGHPPSGPESINRNPKKFLMVELCNEKGLRSKHFIPAIANADFKSKGKIGFHLGLEKRSDRSVGSAYDIVKWVDHERADKAWDRLNLGKLEDCTPKQIRAKLKDRKIKISEQTRIIWNQSADYLESASGQIVYPWMDPLKRQAFRRQHPFCWLKDEPFVLKPAQKSTPSAKKRKIAAKKKK